MTRPLELSFDRNEHESLIVISSPGGRLSVITFDVIGIFLGISSNIVTEGGGEGVRVKG